MKSYDELTITDDFMFSKVMLDEKLCKELVEILLDIKIDRIEYIGRENTIKEDPIGRGIRLDVYIKDSNRVFDIEIQTTNKHDLSQRSRYYQALMDLDNLSTGTKFTELKESYILFICTFDPFDREQVKYVFRERSETINDLFLNDKTYKVFYNIKAYKKSDNKRVQEFLQYLTTKKPESDFTKKLENAVYRIKGHQNWRKEYMTVAMKFDELLEEGLAEGRAKGLAEGRAKGLAEGLAEGRAEGLVEGIAEGIAKNKLETAIKMRNDNFPIESIVKYTGLTKEEIEKM